MTTEPSETYLQRRAAKAQEMAARAAHPSIRQIHLRMASLYAERLDSLVTANRVDHKGADRL